MTTPAPRRFAASLLDHGIVLALDEQRSAPLPATGTTVHGDPTTAEQLAAYIADGPTLRILVADDDAVNRQVAEHMLLRLGQRADFVDDGARAVEACRSVSYDLIFMDVHMPGLDGVAATRQIRVDPQVARQPLIVALTANTLAGDRERFLAAGMDGYLGKPVQLRDLAGALLSAAGEQETPIEQDPTGEPTPHDPDAPIATDALAARLGLDDVGPTLDVLVPVFLGQMGRSLVEVRAALSLEDAETATNLVADAIDSGTAIEATHVVEALRLVGAAVNAARFGSARYSLQQVEFELDALRGWFVDRSVDELSLR